MNISKEEIVKLFVDSIAKEMKTDPEKIDIHAEFFTLGLDSISSIYILDQLEDHLKIDINPLDFWDYPSVEKFSTYLVEERLKA